VFLSQQHISELRDFVNRLNYMNQRKKGLKCTRIEDNMGKLIKRFVDLI